MRVRANKLKDQKAKKKAPTEGIEPSTYGLEVHRAIHCAMRAYTSMLVICFKSVLHCYEFKQADNSIFKSYSFI
jgi:hypothetical protein